MTPIASFPRPGSRADRLPAFACLAGALALALLAGCQSNNSCSMGGSSGYQIDGEPGLMACNMTAPGSTGMASTTPTDITMPDQIALHSAFSNNGFYTPVYYGMARTAGALPASGGTAVTLTLPTGPVSAVTNPGASDYALTASAIGYNPVCEIASGGYAFAANKIYAMSSTSATLRVYYPPFSNTGSFTINCVGVNAANAALVTAPTSITVTVP